MELIYRFLNSPFVEWITIIVIILVWLNTLIFAITDERNKRIKYGIIITMFLTILSILYKYTYVYILIPFTIIFLIYTWFRKRSLAVLIIYFVVTSIFFLSIWESISFDKDNTRITATINRNQTEVRWGPGVLYEVKGKFKKASTVTVYGRDGSAKWMLVREGEIMSFGSRLFGWISVADAQINIPLEDIPIITAIMLPTPSSSPSPSPTVNPIVQAAVPDWRQLVKAALDQVKIGRMLFNPPSEMEVGTTERIEVRITDDPTENITHGLKGRGTPEVQSIQVGTFMKARLSAADDEFEIRPLQQEEQVVAGTYSQWAWDVTPLKPGPNQKLHLVVSVRVKIKELGEETKDLPVIDKEVNVKVNHVYTAKQFLRNNWQFLAGSLAIPLGAYWWNQYRDKTDKDTQGSGSKDRTRLHLPNARPDPNKYRNKWRQRILSLWKRLRKPS